MSCPVISNFTVRVIRFPHLLNIEDAETVIKETLQNLEQPQIMYNNESLKKETDYLNNQKCLIPCNRVKFHFSLILINFKDTGSLKKAIQAFLF